MKINPRLILPVIMLAIVGASNNELEDNFILIPEGVVDAGSNEGLPSERPVKRHTVNAFYLASHPVTVKQYKEFIDATNYVTDAEKYGSSGVFSFEKQQWYLQQGAYWEYPSGPNQDKAVDDHPVTHVSWNDAIAYTNWKGERLPTEVEWEHAARNGANSRMKYPWGDNIKINGKHRANVWQGVFPLLNTNEDGFMTTSSVTQFPPSPIGLYDMAGNVWEWTDSEYKEENTDKMKTIKGGSFLCDPDFCHGFRVSSRMGTTPETSLMHTGFRTVRD
ncbi:MAG: formylglycine-generating enzyme family protein [Pseudomonadota bacterium]|nr:formylglycine-generating enzyme family protein [Pseudomonadota bacterium]